MRRARFLRRVRAFSALVALAGLVSCGTQATDQPTDRPSETYTPPPGVHCTGPPTPEMEPSAGREDTRAEAKAHPEITGADQIRWTKTTGRFRLTMHNGTCASWPGTDLRLDLGGDLGYQPENTKLEYRTGSTWKRVAMDWSDPDEPETLRSSAVPVDFAPGQTRTYDFRITVPRQPDIRSIGMGARLDAAGDHAYEWSSDFSVRSYTGVSMQVSAPPSITPSGGWQEFQVLVEADKKLPKNARLYLSTSAWGGDLIHETTQFEEYRSAGWHPLDRTQPATGDFAMPPGKQLRFKFRVKIAKISNQEKGMFGVGARLLLAGETPGTAPLVMAGEQLQLILPTVRVAQPEHRPKNAGDTAEFRVTVDNGTKVGYPAQKIDFSILPSPYLSRIDYRCDPAKDWTRLPTAAGDTRGSFALPGSAVPAGYHAECRIRITAGKRVEEGLNWDLTMHAVDTEQYGQFVSGHL